MHYKTEITVNVALDEFVKKLQNPYNRKHWQKGLVLLEHINGQPGMIGSKMKLHFHFGKRKLNLTETVIESNLPENFQASYDNEDMYNIQKNYFSRTKDGYTKWISENEFYPKTFFMKLMTTFMKNTFKKQSLTYMSDFKKFAETGSSVSANE